MAITVVASLSAVGALLISALMVVPAATIRLFARRVRTLQLTTIVLVILEGTFGLWLSVETNAPPGATIAVVSGAVFAFAFFGRAAGRRTGVRPLAVAAAVLALAGLAGGCSTESSGGDGPKVVATTTQVQDFVSEVGGDRVDLTGILQPNTDPHEYEPRPSDVKAVADADIIFRSGGHLDEWTENLIQDSGSDATVIDLSEGLPVKLHGDDDHAEEHGGEHESDEEDFDPHWWQDPVNVKAATGEIEAGLTGAASGNAGYLPRHGPSGSKPAIDRLTADISGLHQAGAGRRTGRSSPTTTPSGTSRNASGSRPSAP